MRSGNAIVSGLTIGRLSVIAALFFVSGIGTAFTGPMTLFQVRSYEYAIASGPRTPGINSAIANSPSDLIILGGGDPAAPLNRAAADPNHSKLILGYIETTEASSYAEPDLFSNGAKSSLIGGPISGYSDLYSVQYWDPFWENELFNQVDQLITSGYDGIFLDSLEYTDWTAGNTRGNPVYAKAAAALATLVTDIRAYITHKSLGRPFYLIGNDPVSLAQQYPAVLSDLDAVFNEWVYWGQPPANGLTSTYEGTGTATYLQTTVAALYKNVLVFGNDYPNPLTNLDAAFESFAFYSALGWIPSVTKALQDSRIFSTGPFMFMATPSAARVAGAKHVVNFISGGKTTAATLIGGDQGDYFIGGPGQNTIVGGAGNDTIYAHPANISVRNLLDISLIADVKNGPNPTVSIQINGQIALAPTLVTATFDNNQVQEIKIDTTPFGTVTSIEIDGAGAPYIDQTHYVNIQFQRLTFQGQSISFNQAQFSSRSRALNGGATAIINPSGQIKFSSPTLPITPPVFGDTQDTIDGGGGNNTVIYRGVYSNYTIAPRADGSWIVSSAATAEGTDTLRNVQRLVFSDKTIAVTGLSH